MTNEQTCHNIRMRGPQFLGAEAGRISDSSYDTQQLVRDLLRQNSEYRLGSKGGATEILERRALRDCREGSTRSSMIHPQRGRTPPTCISCVGMLQGRTRRRCEETVGGLPMKGEVQTWRSTGGSLGDLDIFSDLCRLYATICWGGAASILPGERGAQDASSGLRCS